MRTDRIDRSALLRHLRVHFQLDWHGLHGVAHWARVRVNGLMLARETGANAHVVELFAFLHDADRRSEGDDEGHGRRGARLARSLRGEFFDMTSEESELFDLACRNHSEGGLRGDPTVLTCWDADRLDLGRVGVLPLARYLCTNAARQQHVIDTAYRRSLRDVHLFGRAMQPPRPPAPRG